MLRRSLAALICGVLTIGAVAAGEAGDGPPRVVTLERAEPAGAAIVPAHAAWVVRAQQDPIPYEFTAADAVVRAVALYDAPDAPAAAGTLTNPTREGVPLVFLVREQQGDWLHVQVPSRPNGRTAWIRAADVATRSLTNQIVVEVGARRLTAFDALGRILLQEPVAVGQDRYPTPVGEFYLDSQWDNPGGAYGVKLLSVAAYSDVLETFGGGVGQIAIHGTNRPDLIGQPVSHGCIRMTNDAILRLTAIAPMGTPVSIRP